MFRDLTEDQRALVDTIERFARAELAPGALARAHATRFPWEVAQKMAGMGFLGITLSEADGGLGGTLMDAVLAIRTVARFCPKSADVVQAGNFGPIRTFVEYASPAQKDRWLADLLAARKLIALGMTEPDAGSAATELSTHAREDGDAVVVNGSKVFSTHSAEADLFLIYLRFGPGVAGIGSVLVERGTPGFTIGPPARFMSGEEWCPLYFEECRIPRANILLGPGGFKKQIAGFNVERLGNAARALALGRYAFDAAKAHAQQRRQFGKALCEFQGIQWKFAEMAVKLDAAQMLLHRAASVPRGALPSGNDTAMAKLACNLAGWEVANEALQVMGGTGYSTESLVEYCVKRTRGWMIAGGSVEMLKNRIAEHVFERRFDQRA